MTECRSANHCIYWPASRKGWVGRIWQRLGCSRQKKGDHYYAVHSRHLIFCQERLFSFQHADSTIADLGALRILGYLDHETLGIRDCFEKTGLLGSSYAGFCNVTTWWQRMFVVETDSFAISNPPWFGHSRVVNWHPSSVVSAQVSVIRMIQS